MITLSIDPKDAHVLRISASYLLALAGDIDVQITGSDDKVLIKKGIVQSLQVANELLADIKADTFNAAELAEEKTFLNTDYIPPPPTPKHPDAASVFGGKSVPSTVVAEASTTAPADTPVMAQSNVPLPPVPTPEVVAPPVVVPPGHHAVSVEVDSRGLPWDARIHARTKSVLANGEWKVMRGADPALVVEVEAQLRKLLAIPLPPATTVTPPSAPVIGAPPANPSNEVTTFPALMLYISGECAKHTLSQAQVKANVNAMGIDSIPLLIQRPDLIPGVYAALVAQVEANIASGVSV